MHHNINLNTTLGELLAILSGGSRPPGVSVAASKKWMEWVQVGKLAPDDERRMRAAEAVNAHRKEQIAACVSRILALEASIKADGDEWWIHVRKSYGLTVKDLEIKHDGRIMMRAETGKKEA